MTKPVIVTRAGKGSPLTRTELDANFSNIDDATIGVSDGTNSGSLSLNDTLTFAASGSATVAYNNSTKTVTVGASGGATLYDAGDKNSTYTPDYSQGTVQTVRLTGNITLAAPTNMTAGAKMTLIVTQDGTGSRTITWNNNYKFPNMDPSISTNNNAVDTIDILYTGLKYLVTIIKDYKPLALSATGGTVTTQTIGGISYKIHTFTSSGNFVVNGGGLIDILLVGGGGGGVDYYRGGGGGGGGGVLYQENYTVSGTTYQVTVGTGGAGGANSNGSNGQSSTFDSLSALGGNGGTTGGTGGYSGSPTQHSGGGGFRSGSTEYESGGGGGGAGGNGSSSAYQNAGNGGIGLQNSITGTSVYYAGGGGGTSNTLQGSWGNSGNGTIGGGGRDSDSGNNGIVIIRYLA